MAVVVVVSILLPVLLNWFDFSFFIHWRACIAFIHSGTVRTLALMRPVVCMCVLCCHPIPSIYSGRQFYACWCVWGGGISRVIQFTPGEYQYRMLRFFFFTCELRFFTVFFSYRPTTVSRLGYFLSLVEAFTKGERDSIEQGGTYIPPVHFVFYLQV